jgi:hypothetical protein
MAGWWRWTVFFGGAQPGISGPGRQNAKPHCLDLSQYRAQERGEEVAPTSISSVRGRSEQHNDVAPCLADLLLALASRCALSISLAHHGAANLPRPNWLAKRRSHTLSLDDVFQTKIPGRSMPGWGQKVGRPHR